MQIERRIAIVLLHGTWPRGAVSIPHLFGRDRKLWFEMGSEFHTRLAQMLTESRWAVEFVPFCWTGKNSVHERNRAAIALAERLQQYATENPRVPILIVAHSHGGNVALRAAYHLKESARDVHIVTLATPFLRIYAKRLEDQWKFDSNYTAATSLLFWPLMIAPLWWLEMEWHLHPFRSWAAGTACWLVYAVATMHLSRWWQGTGIVLMHELDRQQALAVSASYAPVGSRQLGATYFKWKDIGMPDHAMLDVSVTPASLLVIRGIDDEAALALAAGAIGARLNRFVAVFLGRVLGIPGITVIAILYLTSTWISWGVGDFAGHSILGWALITSLAIGLLAALVLATESLCRGVFGFELLRGAARLEIAANTVPDHEDNVEARTLPPIQKRATDLRHSLYSHKDCIPTIVGWISRKAPGTRSIPIET